MSDSESNYSTQSLPLSPISLTYVPSIVTSHLSNPRTFLSSSAVTYQHCITALRKTHNTALSLHVNNDNNKTTNCLPQLYTDGFDQEQIWQQLELWNVPTFQNLSADVQRLLTADLQILTENRDDDVSDASNHSHTVNEGSELNSESDSEAVISDLDTDVPGIGEYTEYSKTEELSQQDEENASDNEASVQSGSEESDELPDTDLSVAAGLKYRDIFADTPADNTDNNTQSSYTRERDKIQSRIEELERENMAEKGWQMSGEVSSKSRPDNSLLERYMEHQACPVAPRITAEATEALEDLIRRRARDELWDDPVRREKPQEKRYNYSVPTQVNAQKSELGLAEVYEQEFLRQTGASANPLQTDEQTMEDEIKRMMKDVFARLDALSNFRYTPKPYKYAPIQIQNVPAVTVEEVTPSVMSSSTRLAPEEIHAPSRAVVSEIERTREDKGKLRRHKKRAASRKMVLRAQKLVNKTNPGLGNTYSKRKLLDTLSEAKHMQGQREQLIHDERARKRDKSFKSSKTFFSKLEQQAHGDIAMKSVRKKVKVKHRLTVAALKQL